MVMGNSQSPSLSSAWSVQTAHGTATRAASEGARAGDSHISTAQLWEALLQGSLQQKAVPRTQPVRAGMVPGAAYAEGIHLTLYVGLAEISSRLAADPCCVAFSYPMA